jgi:poly(3-hydroxybutyrate) depolymerase
MSTTSVSEVNNENVGHADRILLATTQAPVDNLDSYRLAANFTQIARNQDALPDWFPAGVTDTTKPKFETGVLQTDQTISVDGKDRKYHYYLPKSYDGTKPIPLVVALDGIHLGTNNSLNGMAYSNKLIEQAEKYGFALVIPESAAQSVLGGIKTGYGWNEPNGAVNFTAPQDWSDSRFIRQTMDKLTGQLNIDKQKVFAVGFSHGGLETHQLVSNNPGLFNAIASVHGTVLDSVGQTPGGTRFLAIHGEGDKALPYKGGLGWANWVMATRNHRSTDSKPFAQINRYLDANRDLGPEEKTESTDFRIRSWKRNGEEQPFVKEIFLKDARWGHSWHGRGGEPTFNGTPAPASVLDTNEQIFKNFFGLKPRSS